MRVLKSPNGLEHDLDIVSFGSAEASGVGG